MNFTTIARAMLGSAALALALATVTPAAAQKPFADVGKQPPITIITPSAPWYPAFEKVVDLYEKHTGNSVKLDVVPFVGILEKMRNAVRSGQSPYDLLMINSPWTVEFYEGGFLSPLKDIDP